MSRNKNKNIKKTALITGAAKKIGFEIAKALEADGWNVVVHYNNTKPKWKNSVQADLTNSAEVKNLISAASKKLGGEITLLINNASAFEKVSFAKTTEKLFDDNLNVHLKAPFFLSQAFAKQTKQGHIINIADTNVTRNKTTYFAYLLTKKSLAALSQMLAAELAPTIRVNTILPSSVDGYSSSDKEFLAKREKNIPMKKFAKVEDIISAIKFLNESNLTGQEIFIDGGEQLI